MRIWSPYSDRMLIFPPWKKKHADEPCPSEVIVNGVSVTCRLRKGHTELHEAGIPLDKLERRRPS